jgi:type I restriction enzyme S subunit
MSINKQTEFFDKVDVAVPLAKIIFAYLEKNYECKTIAEIAETTSGGTPLRGHTDYYGGKIPWIKSGELNDGTITETGLKNSSAKIYPKGTLVLALYGATAGKTGIVDFDTASNQAVAAIFPNEEIERDYLFWFFRQKRFEYIQLSFGAAQPNISQTVVKATKIPIPETKTQKQVVAFLNNCETNRELVWNESVEPIKAKLKSFFAVHQKRKILLKEIEQQQTYLQQLRQTILQEAVQGKLTKHDESGEPASELLKRIKAEKAALVKAGKLKKEKELPPITDAEIPFALPKGWVWCRLGEICNLITDGTHLTPRYVDKGRIFLSAQNVKPFKFMPDVHKFVSEEDYQGYIKNRRAEKGDILLTRVGAGIGEAAMIDVDIEFAFYVSLGLLKPNRNCIYSKYLELYLNSPLGRNHSSNKTLGKGVSAGNLNLSLIRSFDFPFPPLTEQKRIVEKVEHLLHHIRQLEEQVTTSQTRAKQLLQAVLQEAFQTPKEYEMNEKLTLAAEE